MPGVRARGGGAGPAPREAAVDPPGMPEPAPGGAEEGTGTRTPHVAGVAPDGIQERRRRGGRRTAPAGGMAQRGRRPSRPRDGRTVLLVGQMHGGAHAARTGNAHGIRGPVDRGPGPVHRTQGHGPDRGPDRLEGSTPMDHGPGHDRHGRRPHARGHVARTRARGGRRMARRPGPRRRRGPAGRRHGPDHRGHMGRGPSRTQRRGPRMVSLDEGARP